MKELTPAARQSLRARAHQLDPVVMIGQAGLTPAVLREIERILYEDGAIVPLHWQHLSWAAVKGVHIADVVNVIDMPYLGDLVMD